MGKSSMPNRAYANEWISKICHNFKAAKFLFEKICHDLELDCKDCP